MSAVANLAGISEKRTDGREPWEVEEIPVEAARRVESA